MDATELRYEIFQLLYEKHVEGAETPSLFVGMQGDLVVVMQAGGEHLAVSVVPANVSVPA